MFRLVLVPHSPSPSQRLPMPMLLCSQLLMLGLLGHSEALTARRQ